MKRQHDDYLDGKLTATHEALMVTAKRKFNFLKLKGKWGAKSPNDKKQEDHGHGGQNQHLKRASQA